MSATITVPTVNSNHVQLGLIDGSGPGAVDNRAFRELLAAGVLAVDPDELVKLKTGGDRITIPAINDPADFDRVDRTSDVDLSANEVATTNDVGVIQYQKVLYQFKTSDVIRSGYDASREYSMKIGGKVAKRCFELLMKVAVGAIDAMDTPTTNCHTLNVYSATTPAYPTVARLRSTKALLGDAQGSLTTCVMHSTAFGYLLSDLITNYGGGSVVGDSALQLGYLGKLLGISTWIVSDLMPTTEEGAAYNTMLFGPNALWLSRQQDVTVEEDKDIKKPSTLQYMAVSFNVCAHLRFLAYADSGENPTDAYLADATKWNEGYDNHRRVLAAKLVTN